MCYKYTPTNQYFQCDVAFGFRLSFLVWAYLTFALSSSQSESKPSSSCQLLTNNLGQYTVKIIPLVDGDIVPVNLQKFMNHFTGIYTKSISTSRSVWPNNCLLKVTIRVLSTNLRDWSKTTLSKCVRIIVWKCTICLSRDFKTSSTTEAPGRGDKQWM